MSSSIIDDNAMTVTIKEVTITVSPYDASKLPRLFKRAGEILEREAERTDIFLDTVDFVIDSVGAHLTLYISETADD